MVLVDIGHLFYFYAWFIPNLPFQSHELNIPYKKKTLLYLLLKVPPQIIPFTFGDEASNPGDSHAVHCTVTKGDVPIDIRWSLNGQPLVNSENGVTIFRMSPRLSSLSIDNVKDIHRGVFKCTASNAAGTTDYATELIVNGILLQLSWCGFN